MENKDITPVVLLRNKPDPFSGWRLNKDQREHRYQLSVSGIEGLELDARSRVFDVAAGEVLSTPISLVVDPVNLKTASSKIQFTLESLDDPDIRVEESGRFIGPLIP